MVESPQSVRRSGFRPIRAVQDFLRLPPAEGAAAAAVVSTYLVPYLVSGVALSHIFGLLLILAAAVKTVRSTSRGATVTLLLFCAILLMSMAAGLLLGSTSRFWTEATKTAIVFLIAFFAGIAIPAPRLYAILQPGPWLCAILIGLIFLLVGNPFSLDGRLTLTGFISPNVLGFLIVLNMAVLLCRENMEPLTWGLFGILTVSMVACLSRSALLATLALMLARIGWLRGAALLGVIGGVLAVIFSHNATIQRMLVVEDVMTTGGSGRSDLWHYLLTRWLHTPLAWPFGFGPGSVERVLNIISRQEAAHSLVLGSLYYWGLAGFLFIVICAILAIRGVSNAPPSREKMLARDIVLVVITNGLVDESYDGSQVNVVSALFMALVVAVIVESRRRAKIAQDGMPEFRGRDT
jgi:hypothetical protein